MKFLILFVLLCATKSDALAVKLDSQGRTCTEPRDLYSPRKVAFLHNFSASPYGLPLCPTWRITHDYGPLRKVTQLGAVAWSPDPFSEHNWCIPLPRKWTSPPDLPQPLPRNMYPHEAGTSTTPNLQNRKQAKAIVIALTMSSTVSPTATVAQSGTYQTTGGGNQYGGSLGAQNITTKPKV